MPPRLQPRRIAREVALLSLSQVTSKSEILAQEELNNLVLGAIRTLKGEIKEALENAADEVKRGNDQLFYSETRATSFASAKAMVEDAIALTQKAINRLGYALELPEFIELANKTDVREYTIELISTVTRRKDEIKEQLNSAMVDWQLSRLPQVDRDILRIAVAEILFLDLQEKIAINEAIELAKRYSDDDGYRFINGVLRRFSDRLKQVTKQ